jgi:hypothetical protein
MIKKSTVFPGNRDPVRHLQFLYSVLTGVGFKYHFSRSSNIRTVHATCIELKGQNITIMERVGRTNRKSHPTAKPKAAHKQPTETASLARVLLGSRNQPNYYKLVLVS